MLNQESDAAWKKFGEDDPYFGVISHDKFRRSRLDEDARREFFDTGAAHVDRLFEIVRTVFHADVAPRRALDFGCGVGRVLIPLAARCGEVVGVDVSEGMLAEAKRNCADRGITNAHLESSLGDVPGRFDLVHSYIVLQHIPVRRGFAYIAAMLERLEDGGFGAIHVTYAKSRPGWKKAAQWMRARVPGAHGVGNLLQGRAFSAPLMQMNSYDVNRLLLLLQEHGCTRIHTHLTDHGGYRGAMLFFRRGGPEPEF